MLRALLSDAPDEPGDDGDGERSAWWRRRAPRDGE